MTRRSILRLSLAVVIALTWPAGTLQAQSPRHAPHQQHHAQHHPPQPGGEEEHEGDPKDWKFTLPKGDPVRGRRVFVRMECYSCHGVKGERFPQKHDLGPELSHMGEHHSAEFIGESILNPNAFIDPEPRFKGPDGSSKMPSFNEVMTVQELVDLVAFIKNLKPPSRPAGSGRAPAPPAGDDHKH